MQCNNNHGKQNCIVHFCPSNIDNFPPTVQAASYMVQLDGPLPFPFNNIMWYSSDSHIPEVTGLRPFG